MKKIYHVPQTNVVALRTDETIMVGSNIKVVPDEEHSAEDALIKENSSTFDFQWE